jgi:hypothetical protein
MLLLSGEVFMLKLANFLRIHRIFTLSLIGLGLVLYIVACAFKPKVNTFTNINDPNSILLKAMNCDESLGIQDGWVWASKSIYQTKEKDYERVLCTLGGHYGDEIKQNRFLLDVSIRKRETAIALDPNSVVVNYFTGNQIAPLNFVRIGQVMFSRCLQNSEAFHCAISVQHGSFTELYVSAGGDNGIPLSSVEKLVNTLLTQEDALIMKNIVP